jgi:hypothetical protein
MARTNSGSLIRDSVTAEPVAAVPELDLYDELASFAELAPDERRQKTEQMQREQYGNRSDGEPLQFGASSAGGGFEVVEMSKTKPLVKRPLRSEEDPSMITACPSCGASNPCDDLFCDSCGAFLA